MCYKTWIGRHCNSHTHYGVKPKRSNLDCYNMHATETADGTATI